MCDMTHSYAWQDSFICVTSRIHMLDSIHMCNETHSCVCHDSFISVTWLIHTCDRTHSYVCHNSLICVTWLNSCVWRVSFMYAMTHSYKRRDTFIYVPWLIRICDTPLLTMRHDASVYVWNACLHMGVVHMAYGSFTWDVKESYRDVRDMTHSLYGYFAYGSFASHMNESYRKWAICHVNITHGVWLIHMGFEWVI